MIRWGIVGPGGIARRFVAAMANVAGGDVVAVSSRAAERAAAFAAELGIARSYGDDDALAADEGIDAIYIATPHTRHAADTLRFIEAGRHVLCEKPFAINAAEARAMAAAARANRVFLMEALWSRFLPSYRLLGELVRSGRIGEPLLVDADFGFRLPVDPAARHFDLAQGGGALLDLGIYPIHLSSFVLGPVTGVSAAATIGTTGVDEQVAAVLQHGPDRLGVVRAALRAPLACTGRIAGSEGTIELPAFVHCPRSLTVRAGLAAPETIECGWDGDGLEFEIEEVHRCIAEGLTESPTMPLDDSIALASVLDEVRARIGLAYPGE